MQVQAYLLLAAVVRPYISGSEVNCTHPSQTGSKNLLASMVG